MARYMLLLGGADLDKRSGNPQLAERMLEDYSPGCDRSPPAATSSATYKLYDQTGTRLSVRGGEVVDGPFIETKEAIGGIFVVEAASLEEATTLARELRPPQPNSARRVCRAVE